MQFCSIIHVQVSKCLALSVNAKDVSGCVRFRRKLLFHWCSFIHVAWIVVTMFFPLPIVLAEYSYSCVYLIFRYQLIATCMGVGVVSSSEHKHF